MDWYKFPLKDYKEVTKNLSDAEDLAFRRLIDLYYIGEGPLPCDKEQLQKAVGLDWDCIHPVLEEFFFLQENGYVNQAFQEDVDKRIDRRMKNVRAGRQGGRPKSKL